MQHLVKLTDIDKCFPGVRALKRARFELLAGEVHALMGENGAGKSTLMKILAGIYQKDGGQMIIDGRVVAPGSPAEAQHLGIGIIHQELSLMNELTVAQNIFIGREPRFRFGRLDERTLKQDTIRLLSTMKVDIKPDETVHNLTIAKQQMVEIAKALSYRPRILIMDEPTAALNDQEVTELFTIIRGLTADGVGIIYISHRMDELKRIADRVTVMRDGEYIDTVAAKKTPTSKIISMMVGRDLNETSVRASVADDTPAVLQVRGITRGRAVRDVSFSVGKGEIFGLAGLMGAGRTEVARAIFGADPMDAGDILVAGNHVKIRSPVDAVKCGIGYLSEDRKRFGLATGMSVADNTIMATVKQFTMAGTILKPADMQRRAEDFVAQLKIRTPSINQEVRFLSGGNQQKVVIAKWLLRNCRILLFDEPTRGIDIGAKSEIYRLLDELSAQGKAIVVISSELPEIMRVSDRIGVMCEGRLAGILPGGSKTTQEDIMKLATRHDDMGQ